MSARISLICMADTCRCAVLVRLNAENTLTKQQNTDIIQAEIADSRLIGGDFFESG
jgi:hypothetical protein